jgi:hypothetical protein
LKFNKIKIKILKLTAAAAAKAVVVLEEGSENTSTAARHGAI